MKIKDLPIDIPLKLQFKNLYVYGSELIEELSLDKTYIKKKVNKNICILHPQGHYLKYIDFCTKGYVLCYYLNHKLVLAYTNDCQLDYNLDIIEYKTVDLILDFI